MNQPILLVNRLRRDGLEGGRGHIEGKGRKQRADATRAALSMMDMVGPGRGLPRGASFAGWGSEDAEPFSRMYVGRITAIVIDSQTHIGVWKRLGEVMEGIFKVAGGMRRLMLELNRLALLPIRNALTNVHPISQLDCLVLC